MTGFADLEHLSIVGQGRSLVTSAWCGGARLNQILKPWRF
jgi:hypothetical protein